MDGVFGSDTGAAVLVRPDGYAGLTSPISSAVGHLALLRVRQQLAPPEIPDGPISGIRLSDWLHREAHGMTPATAPR